MYKSWRATRVLASIAILMGLVVGAAALTANIRIDLSPAVNLPLQTVSAAHQWDWTSQAWTGSDTSYQQIKAQIDRAVTVGNDPQRLLKRQAEVARQHPNNPQAQFAWGYAVFVSMPQWGGDYEHNKAQAAPSEALAKLPAADSYEYTRLRFLLIPVIPYANAGQSRSDQRHLDSLGQRLLQHDPADYEVRYKLVHVEEAVLAWKPFDPAVKARALQYAQQLIQAKPAVDAYRSLPAGIYITCWTQTNDPADARAAIASYQDFLRIASPSNEFRPFAKHLISVLQDALDHPKQ